MIYAWVTLEVGGGPAAPEGSGSASAEESDGRSEKSGAAEGGRNQAAALPGPDAAEGEDQDEVTSWLQC